MSSLAIPCCSFTKCHQNLVLSRPKSIFFMSLCHVLFAHFVVLIRCLQACGCSTDIETRHEKEMVHRGSCLTLFIAANSPDAEPFWNTTVGSVRLPNNTGSGSR